MVAQRLIQLYWETASTQRKTFLGGPNSCESSQVREYLSFQFLLPMKFGILKHTFVVYLQLRSIFPLIFPEYRLHFLW